MEELRFKKADSKLKDKKFTPYALVNFGSHQKWTDPDTTNEKNPTW